MDDLYALFFQLCQSYNHFQITCPLYPGYRVCNLIDTRYCITKSRIIISTCKSHLIVHSFRHIFFLPYYQKILPAPGPQRPLHTPHPFFIQTTRFTRLFGTSICHVHFALCFRAYITYNLHSPSIHQTYPTIHRDSPHRFLYHNSPLGALSTPSIP